MENGFRKLGWHWTRQGWKRTPQHWRAIKKVAAPPKRRRRKIKRVAPAPKELPPTFAKTRQLAVEQGRAVSAPTLAPEAAKRARRAWSGKYDALSMPQGPQGRAGVPREGEQAEACPPVITAYGHRVPAVPCPDST